MKKRIFALIMAGLLTASLASCVSTGTKDTGGSESIPPIHTGSNKNDDPVDPVDNFVAVNKTLYVITSTAVLRAEASAGGAKLADLPMETEVKCTKQNGTWSYVEFNGSSGYVLNSALTDIDILAKSFTAVEGGEKTMYVIDENVNIRLYPATDAELGASKIMGSLGWNDTVTVVSTNSKWSRIKYVDNEGATHYYFVSSSLLSAEKQIDFSDESQYLPYFEECTPVTRYTNGTVNLRESPYLGSDKNIIVAVKTDAPVTVVATGTIAGVQWSRVSVKIEPTTAGDSAYYEEGYISSAYLSEKPTTAPVVLSEVLALYPGLAALTSPAKMYATQNVYIRSTPENFSSTFTDNKATVISEKEEVTVVASGTYKDYDCYVLEYTLDGKDGYYFILSSYLTINSDGTPMLTLDDITAFHKEFTILDSTYTATVTLETANCYLTPKNGETPSATLTRGTTVTVVAEETGSINNAWVVIRTSDGALHFISKDAVQKVSG